jgi:phosphate:Na+ symporter
MPFISLLERIVITLFPSRNAYTCSSLDPIIKRQSPSLAVSQVSHAVKQMTDDVVKSCHEAFLFFQTPQQHHAKKVMELEKKVNEAEVHIHQFLVSISHQGLSEKDTVHYFSYLTIVKDLERISDHTINIVEIVQNQRFTGKTMTPQALENLGKMFHLTIETIQISIEAFLQKSFEKAVLVFENEKQIDLYERKLRQQHILRLQEGICETNAGIFYIDLISNLERMGDHAVNIADLVVHENKQNGMYFSNSSPDTQSIPSQ